MTTQVRKRDAKERKQKSDFLGTQGNAIGRLRRQKGSTYKAGDNTMDLGVAIGKRNLGVARSSDGVLPQAFRRISVCHGLEIATCDWKPRFKQLV